jgi:hypothetical protein
VKGQIPAVRKRFLNGALALSAEATGDWKRWWSNCVHQQQCRVLLLEQETIFGRRALSIGCARVGFDRVERRRIATALEE